MTFSYNSLTLLLALAAAAIFALKKWSYPANDHPAFPFSSLRGIPETPFEASGSFYRIPSTLFSWAFFFFAIAFCDFHFMGSPKQDRERAISKPAEGVALYLVIDQSGSMGESIVLFHPEDDPHLLSKLDLLKQVTTDFVWGNTQKGLEGRQEDLIGLVTFARTAHVRVPLTLDRSSLKDVLGKLKTVQTKEEDGTALGYAILKTANILQATKALAQTKSWEGPPPYDIKSSAMVVITDGFQSPSPLDQGNRLRNISLEESAMYAKEHGIRIYLISVDPRVSLEEFSPQKNLLERTAESTGGRLFLVNDQKSLHQVYREIDQLEKSEIRKVDFIPELPPQRLFSLYPFLLAMGVIFLFFSHLLQTMVWRIFP